MSDVKTVIEFEILSLGLRPHPGNVPPIKNVTQQPDLATASVEFTTVQDAEIALSMASFEFQSTTLGIARPAEYKAAPSQTYDIPDRTFPPKPVLDASDKIYLGNIPVNLGESDVHNFVASFGSLKDFSLVCHRGTGHSLGFAFFRFQDPGKMQSACDGLNGFVLSGCKLDCEKYIPKDIRGNLIPTLQGQLTPAVSAVTSAIAPTVCVVLENMVNADELKDDEEVEEIEEDVKEECEKYGTITEVLIPRPGVGDQKDVGKIFVMYADITGSKRAAQGINGRKFANRTITTHYVSVATFEALKTVHKP
jgi:splicing factor U2AF subunit